MIRARPEHIALAAAVALLACASPAAAHVVISPERVPGARTSLVGVVAQEERPGHVTTRVVVAAPSGVRLQPVETKHGRVMAQGARVRWSRGRSKSGLDPTFVVEVTPGPRAGLLDLQATQTYDDGVVRHWIVKLAVAPATGSASPSQHLGRGLIVAVVGFVLVGGSVAAIHLLRRRELQDS